MKNRFSGLSTKYQLLFGGAITLLIIALIIAFSVISKDSTSPDKSTNIAQNQRAMPPPPSTRKPSKQMLQAIENYGKNPPTKIKKKYPEIIDKNMTDDYSANGVMLRLQALLSFAQTDSFSEVKAEKELYMKLEQLTLEEQPKKLAVEVFALFNQDQDMIIDCANSDTGLYICLGERLDNGYQESASGTKLSEALDAIVAILNSDQAKDYQPDNGPPLADTEVERIQQQIEFVKERIAEQKNAPIGFDKYGNPITDPSATVPGAKAMLRDLYKELRRAKRAAEYAPDSKPPLGREPNPDPSPTEADPDNLPKPARGPANG